MVPLLLVGEHLIFFFFLVVRSREALIIGWRPYLMYPLMIGWRPYLKSKVMCIKNLAFLNIRFRISPSIANWV